MSAPLEQDTSESLRDLDEEMELVALRAGELGRHGKGPATVSFTSLWLSLLISDHELRAWAQRQLRSTGPRIEDIVSRWKDTKGAPPDFDMTWLDEARGAGISRPAHRLDAITPSAEGVLRAAREIASNVSPKKAVGCRHLLAAYLFRPPGHQEDYETWKLDRGAWAWSLVKHVAFGRPEERAGWLKLHAECFPRKSSVGIQQAREWATTLARAANPPATEIDVALLLEGVLLDGETFNIDEDAKLIFSSVWLANALGGKPLALLGLEKLPARSASDEVATAADTRQTLAWAGVIAAATGTEDGETHVMHLLGAILTDHLPARTAELLKRAGTTAGALQAAFFDWVRTRVDEKTIAVWRRFLVEDPLDFAGYANDDADGKDRLDIERDVNALAAVLASEKITPPLSIGLFGDWGSGKSFFMKALGRRIDALAVESRVARAAGRPTSYCGDVIQIQFNAWHYMDGNLWANLAAHIFDDLTTKLSKVDKPSAEQLGKDLTSLAERRKELTREREAIAKGAEALDEKLAQHRRERATKKLAPKDVKRKLHEKKHDAAKTLLDNVAPLLGLEKLDLTLDQAMAEKRRLEHLGGRIAAWWRSLGSPWKVVMTLAMAAPVAVVFIARNADLSRFESAVTAITTALASLTFVAGSIRARVQPALKMIEDAVKRADEAEQELRSELSKEEQQARKEREKLAEADGKLERERAALAERQAAIEVELKALEDGRSFRKYVLERAASDDYRKQRGLIASIHRDFSALSERLANKTDPPYVERIVLYIDDLDRCPPDRVVEVLQAVHLILAMKLFVVVVAVDSRWLLQSLDAYYAKQFQRAEGVRGDGGWESKPQHYLEKIFQIPFTLPPMGRSGFSELVTSLLTPHLAAAKRETSGERDTPPLLEGASRSSGDSGDEKQAGQGSERGGADSETRGQQERRAPERQVHALDLTPRNLEIEPFELESLAKLAPVVSTPRAAKRLVNLYRIIRATLDDDELHDFVQGRYRIHQMLLATVVGSPALAAEMFDEIFTGRVKDGKALLAFVGEKAKADSRWAPLKEIFDEEAVADWHAVRDAARAAGRYSFETGRVLRPASKS